jgi:asparagine synthase (glutamine-hydrolysing)
MSRIGGIVTVGGKIAPDKFAPCVARALKSRPTWHDARLGDDGAALIWAGWRTPVAAEQGGVSAVVDGIFYNREELGDASDDAARLIALYRRHGFEDGLSRINGDFAVALYDRARGTLWIGRDRLGIRPLFYVARPGFFAFASRPRALLTLPGIDGSIDHRFAGVFAASHYRVFDNAPDRSPYAEIAQLPAGSALELRDGRTRVARWWTLAEEPELTDDAATLADCYRALLMDAVTRRVRALERPVFTLSGGLDSSSVLSCAAAATGTPQPAYSTVYADATYDERAEIQPMLGDRAAPWNPVEIGDDIDVFGIVGRMVEAHDEPVATATWLSHFLLAQRVAEDGAGAIFGGLGGDELNAGEYEYFIYRFADLAADGRGGELDNEIACWARHHDHPIFRKTPEVARAAMAKLAGPGGEIRVDRQRLARYRAALDPNFFDLDGYTPAMDHPFRSHLKNRTFQDLFRETAPCCLRAEDRQCTAFGLDHADPFLDHRLIEFMFRVPGALKIRDGITKRLLRDAMQGVLPEETRTRIAKTGWNAPAHKWFTGRGLATLRDLVASRAFRERGIYRVAEVERILDEHEAIVASGAARENHMMFLWQLVNLETWLTLLEEARVAP